ncbi:MAG: hypothetical protein L0Y71_01505 [Gemmataceae bacterium]|nr:hypothetical protein [Gemmataceae bacterium]
MAKAMSAFFKYVQEKYEKERAAANGVSAVAVAERGDSEVESNTAAGNAKAAGNGKAAAGKGQGVEARKTDKPGADGLGAEAGKGDTSVGLRATKDGANLTIKHEKKFPVGGTNFMVWVIPCYVKGDFKVSVEGTAVFGDSSGGSIGVTGAGSVELGVGGTSKEVTAGPYGSIELSVPNKALSVMYGEKNGWEVEATTISIMGTGKVGIKVEINDGPSLNVDQEVVSWELFVLCIGRYADGKFEFFNVRAGKDLMRLIAALEKGGPQIEAAVEKYAPQFVKDAAVKGAEWTAESKTAENIADKTSEVLDKVKEETGVDVGAGVEELVQSLVDENGETSQEATDRVNEEMRKFEDCRDDLHTCMAASGLDGELRPFRSTEEYNKIVDCWQAESENVAMGKDAPGAWRGMIDALIQTARTRQKQKKAEEAGKEKQKKDALQAEIDKAVAMMEGARTGAIGQGNVLNNRLKASPNANVQPIHNKGYSEFAWAENARQAVQGAQGHAKIQQAASAAAAYLKAKETWTTGIHQL